MIGNSPLCQLTALCLTIPRLEQSRAQRIIWLLEELNLKYELKTYKRGKDMLAPKELRDIHPLGKSPVISVEGPSGTPKVIAESGVIVEYISEHFGTQLIPKRYPEGKDGEPGAETEEWTRYRFYMHYAEGSIMPPLLMSLAFMRKQHLTSMVSATSLTYLRRTQRPSSTLHRPANHQSHR
jgi:glutathione S-transferase